jgi:branched-chain amino acid transport system substrate-binding protein
VLRLRKACVSGMGQRAMRLRRRQTWFLLVGAATLLALAAAGCGGGEEGPETPTVTRTQATTAATPQPTSPTAAASPGATGSPVVGVNGEIVLGSHFAQTGTYGAAFAPVLAGLKAYVNYLNAEKGGVCGRKIVFKTEDDQCGPLRRLGLPKR